MKKKRVILLIIVTLVIIQFIKVDKNNPDTDNQKDFLAVVAPPSKIATMIKNSCYDCHSNEVNYPWYSNIAPVSWLIKNHINEAREHVNFSEWADYAEKEQQHILDECAEEVEEGEMPLSGYLLMHKEARLSEKDREELENYFKKTTK